MDQGGKDKPRKEQKEKKDKKETKKEPKKQEKKSIVEKVKEKAKQVKEKVKEVVTGKKKESPAQKKQESVKQSKTESKQGNSKQGNAKQESSKKSEPKVSKADVKQGGGTNQKKSSDKLDTKGKDKTGPLENVVATVKEINNNSRAILIGAAIGVGIEGGLIKAEDKLNQIKVSKLKTQGDSIEINLKYKEGWTREQRAQADAKVEALNKADLVKTEPSRSGTSAAARYKQANGPDSIPKGSDIDHTVDLQLGGADNVSNMKPLNTSVNRSLGKQIYDAIKDYIFGTKIDKINIK